MGIEVYDDDGVVGFYADTLTVTERETHSQLLGPDGEPLQYEEPQPFGFDLSPRK